MAGKFLDKKLGVNTLNRDSFSVGWSFLPLSLIVLGKDDAILLVELYAQVFVNIILAQPDDHECCRLSQVNEAKSSRTIVVTDKVFECS